MRRTCCTALGLVVVLITGCGAGDLLASAHAAGPSPPASVPGGPSSSLVQRVPLPAGFPVLPGAAPVAMPSDDPGLIGLWTTAVRGSGAYDYYVDALPRAGYPIVAVHPGGEVAVIRFSLPDGLTWQVVTHGDPDGTVAIEVRIDRP